VKKDTALLTDSVFYCDRYW